MSDLASRIRTEIVDRVRKLRAGDLIRPDDVLCSWGIGSIQEIRPGLRIDWDAESGAFRVGGQN